MRTLLSSLVVLALIPSTLADPAPARFRLRTTAAGIHRLDAAALGDTLPCPVERLHLRHAGATVPLWVEDAAGRPLASGEVTRGCQLYFVARAYPGPGPGDAVHQLTVGGPPAAGTRLRPATLTATEAGADSALISVTLAPDRLRASLRRVAAPIAEPPPFWYWAVVRPGARRGTPLALALPAPPVAGPALLEVALRADQAPGGVNRVSLWAGARRLGGHGWEGGGESLARVRVPDASALAGGLTLHAHGDRPVLVDRVRCIYRARATATDGRLVFGLMGEAAALRVGGLGPGPALVLCETGGVGQRVARGEGLTLAASRPAGGLVIGQLDRVTAVGATRIPDRARGPRVDYLALCPASLSASLAPLLAHRRAEGLSVREVTPQAVYDDTGDGHPTAAAIRAYLRRERPRFCLLVGDSTGAANGLRPDAPLIPTGIVTTFPEGHTASDHWLADVDGDGRAEVSIGRFPAGSAAELTRMVAKTIRYETSGDTGDWRRQLHFVTGPGRFSPAADRFLEGLVARLLVERLPDHFGVTMTYANPESPYCPAPSRIQQTVLGRLNDGALLLAYVGHGYEYGLDSLRDGRTRHRLLHVRDMEQVASTRGLPIVGVIACSTAAFDGSRRVERACLGEALLRRPAGPVAFFGSTRISHPYANAMLGKALLGPLLGPGPVRLGPALDAARAELTSGSRDVISLLIDGAAHYFTRGGPSLERLRREHAYLYALLGDPALKVAKPPVGLTLSGPATARRGAPFTITGRSAGLAAGEVTLDLVIRRDRQLQPPVPVGADRDAAMTTNYERANARRAGRWTVPLTEGRFSARLRLAAGLPVGDYRVVAVARSGPRMEVGSWRVAFE